jgi:hypothetical protein
VIQAALLIALQGHPVAGLLLTPTLSVPPSAPKLWLVELRKNEQVSGPETSRMNTNRQG